MARNTEPELELDEIDDEEPDAPKQLREYAKRQAQKAKLADQLVRENAFLKAGVDLTTRKGQAFAAIYAGDINDAQAILADAQDFDPGIIRGAAAPATTTDTSQGTGTGEATTTTDSNQATGTNERTALANGSTASGESADDVRSAAMATAREAMERGAGQDEAAGSFIAAMARGAAEGKVPVFDATGRPIRIQQ